MSDEKKPLKDPEIFVKVTPKDKKNPEHQKVAEVVKEKLTDAVKKAIETKKPDGQEEQFRAAESEAKKAGNCTSPKQIKEISVGVAGKDKDDDGVERGWSVIPKEGKSAS